MDYVRNAIGLPRDRMEARAAGAAGSVEIAGTPTTARGRDGSGVGAGRSSTRLPSDTCARRAATAARSRQRLGSFPLTDIVARLDRRLGVASKPEPGVLAIDDAALMAVQIIKLKPDGSGKADSESNKIIIGKDALGAPIVVAPPNDLLGLAICEGLRDALFDPRG